MTEDFLAAYMAWSKAHGGALDRSGVPLESAGKAHRPWIREAGLDILLILHILLYFPDCFVTK
jgi:hypothetical protein